MNTEDKIKVMQAFLEGEEIEARVGYEDWWTIADPTWNWASMEYRIKEKDYSLDIPWEFIDDKWKWTAMDDDGLVYIYTEKPLLESDGWWYQSSQHAPLPLKIKPDVKFWDKTLTERPQGA